MSNCQQSRLCPYCCVYNQISVCMPYAYPHFVFAFLTGCKFLPCYYRKDRALQIRGNSRVCFFWGGGVVSEKDFFSGCLTAWLPAFLPPMINPSLSSMMPSLLSRSCRGFHTDRNVFYS